MTLYAGPDKATQNTLQFAVKNIGTQTVSADSYNFTTQLVNENNTVAEGVSYKTYIINGEDTTLYEDNVIPEKLPRDQLCRFTISASSANVTTKSVTAEQI